MIPKKIHYCWFGKGKKPGLVNFCIASWEKVQPDFEIVEWNEDNFDVNSILFTREAYKRKKWAFVSDYVRAKALYEEGGFYLDTDMELKLPLEEFRSNAAICSFEMVGTPFSAFWAVEKGHILARDIKEYYEKCPGFTEIPNTKIFSELLVSKYGATANLDQLQNLKHGVILYPSPYFSLDLPKNYVSHHFSGSWHSGWTSKQNDFKSLVNTYGLMKLFSEIPNGKSNVHNVIYNHKLMKAEEILDQLPLKYIFSYVLRKIRNKLMKR